MKPLEGIKVVDLSQFAAAPVVGRILGEWGADVIKVETAKGDSNRYNGFMTKVPMVSDDENPAFDACSAFKRYICVNMKTPEGSAIVAKLLETADVLILNFREDSAKRIGMDWDTIHAKYPRLIYVRSTGFGDAGPMKDVGAFDMTAYYSRGGISTFLRQNDGEPINNVPCYGDFQQALGLAAGTLAAIIGREKTGEGDRVLGNLYGTALFMLSWGLQGYEGGQRYPISRKTPSGGPTSNCYPTADGKWIQLCGPTYDLFYPRLMKNIGREDLVDDPRYTSWNKVLADGTCGEVRAIVEEAFLTRPASEWEAIFQADDYACQRLFDSEDIMNDEQAWACGALRMAKYPSGNEHLYVSLPMRLDSVGLPELEGNMAKRIGHDTKTVLMEYGYTEEQIEEWAKSGAIGI